jgi:hypothetical protein
LYHHVLLVLDARGYCTSTNMFAVALEGVFVIKMECPAWFWGGRRPLIAGCSSLERL